MGIALDLDLDSLQLAEQGRTSASASTGSPSLASSPLSSPLLSRSSSLRQNNEGQRHQFQRSVSVASSVFVSETDEDSELAGLWASPFQRPASAGHVSNLSSCSEDSGVDSVASSRTVSESDDGWGGLAHARAAAAPAFQPTDYDLLTAGPSGLQQTAAPPAAGPSALPARLNPPAVDVLRTHSAASVGSFASSEEAGDGAFALGVVDDGMELTHTQIKHALPEWMCAEVCQLKRKKTRRGCRGHRRNRKKREEDEQQQLQQREDADGAVDAMHLPRSTPLAHKAPPHMLYQGQSQRVQESSQQQQQQRAHAYLSHQMQAVPVFVPSSDGGYTPIMALQPVSWQQQQQQQQQQSRGLPSFATQGHNFVSPGMLAH